MRFRPPLWWRLRWGWSCSAWPYDPLTHRAICSVGLVVRHALLMTWPVTLSSVGDHESAVRLALLCSWGRRGLPQVVLFAARKASKRDPAFVRLQLRRVVLGPTCHDSISSDDPKVSGHTAPVHGECRVPLSWRACPGRPARRSCRGPVWRRSTVSAFPVLDLVPVAPRFVGKRLTG
jgi:hypothetical protein